MDQPQPVYYSPFLKPLDITFTTKKDSNLHPVLDTTDDGTVLLKAPKELSIGGHKQYTINTGLSVKIPELITVFTQDNKWQSTLDVIGEVFPHPTFVRDHKFEITYPKIISRTCNSQDIVLHLLNRGVDEVKIPQYSVFACIRFMYVPKVHVSLIVEESNESFNRHQNALR